MLPLKGIKVVSIEQAVAAPFATRQLADLGAEVIKVERPKVGDFARSYDTTVKGMASHFVWTNRSKKSIALDLKQEESKIALEKLISEADVFLHNLAPGAVSRLGFGSDVLKEKYPRLINCSISGYGANGSYTNKKAYDLLVQCEAGVVSITGTEDTPSKVGVSIADIAAGMYAYTGVLTALIARGQTGKGDVIEVSMLEALAEWMGYPFYYGAYSGTDPKRTGASHPTIYPYGPFLAGDKRAVFLGIQNEREWANFCELVLEQKSLTMDERFNSNSNRVANSSELKNIIEKKFSELDSEFIMGRLEETGIANARLNRVKDLATHPQLQQRKRWREVDSPAGMIKALIPPVTSENISAAMDPIPDLGEHTLSVLRDHNISEEVIEKIMNIQ